MSIKPAPLLLATVLLLTSGGFADNPTHFGSFLLSPVGLPDPSDTLPNVIWTFDVGSKSMVPADYSLAIFFGQHAASVRVVSLSYGLDANNYVIDEGFAFNTYELVDGSISALPGSAQALEHPLDFEATLFVVPNIPSELNEFRGSAKALEENSDDLPNEGDALLSVDHVALWGGYTGKPFSATQPSKIVGFDHHPPSTKSRKYFTVDTPFQYGGQTYYPSDVLRFENGVLSIEVSHDDLGLAPSAGSSGEMDYITSLAVDMQYYLLNNLPRPSIQFTLRPDSDRIQHPPPEEETDGGTHFLYQKGLDPDPSVGPIVWRSAASGGGGDHTSVTSVDTIDPWQLVQVEITPNGTRQVVVTALGHGTIVGIERNGLLVPVPPAFDNGTVTVDLPPPGRRFHVRVFGLLASGEAWSCGKDFEVDAATEIPNYITGAAVTAQSGSFLMSLSLLHPLDPTHDAYVTIDESIDLGPVGAQFTLPALAPGHHTAKLQIGVPSNYSLENVVSFEIPSTLADPTDLRITRLAGAALAPEEYKVNWNLNGELAGSLFIRAAVETGSGLPGGGMAYSGLPPFFLPPLSQGRYIIEVRNSDLSAGSSRPLRRELLVGPRIPSLEIDEPDIVASFPGPVGDIAYSGTDEVALVLRQDSTDCHWVLLHGLSTDNTARTTLGAERALAITSILMDLPEGLTPALAWITNGSDPRRQDDFELRFSTLPRVGVEDFVTGATAVAPTLISSHALTIPGSGEVTSLTYDDHGPHPERLLVARGGLLYEISDPLPSGAFVATSLGLQAHAVAVESDGCYAVLTSARLDAVVDYKADTDDPFSVATLASGSLSTQFSGMVHVPMGRAATGRLLMSSGNTLIQQRGRRVIRPVYETETVYP
ncbi:MAG: hypothetical protein KDC38_00425 [Planctomycetes bacterium]|nr:hypothetical protein [Planctomycetota bacterium]